MSEKPNWKTLEKEFKESDQKRRYHLAEMEKAFDKMLEIWGTCSKNEDEFWKWRKVHSEKCEK